MRPVGPMAGPAPGPKNVYFQDVEYKKNLQCRPFKYNRIKYILISSIFLMTQASILEQAKSRINAFTKHA